MDEDINIEQQWTPLSVNMFVVDIIVLVIFVAVFFIYEYFKTQVKPFGMFEMRYAKKQGPTEGIYVLTVYRICVLIWAIFTLISFTEYLCTVRGKCRPIEKYQYLTVLSFCILIGYYFISSVVSIMRIIMGEKYPRLNYLLEYHVHLIYQVAFTSAFNVSLFYFALLVPVQVTKGIFLFYYSLMAIHAGNSAALGFEYLLLRYVRFDLRHLFIHFVYPVLYSIWVTLLVKLKVIGEFPYDGLMSFDTNPMALYYKIIVAASFPISFYLLFGIGKVFRVAGKKVKVCGVRVITDVAGKKVNKEE